MLLCYNAPNGEEENFRIEKQKITIGRSLDVDLTINNRMASRLHCAIECKDGQWHIHDLNSRNGTYLNGERVKSAPLTVGDRIGIGDTIFAFELANPKGTETVIRELQTEMKSGGKGFKTMMIEIAGDGKEDKKSSTDKIIP
ncbi:MAG: FHA domain-containing protein [Kiritimatiellia bacterium]|nr:FHA domain-containing protein [Kiritimatiellia bacterium]